MDPNATRADASTRSATLPLSASDALRARELYKYYNPEQTAVTASQSSAPPDTVLTAYAQLVAWRLNAQRSLVSLIDRETQYFVAESTKTLSLEDNTLHDDPSDAIWAGCINVPKAGRLCEHTLQTMPGPDGPACFEVLDLSKDPRFNQLPFVSGPPYFRYYAGVPIRTKKGVNIGSVFGMDIMAREPLSDSNRMFLTTMANNIMMHLEMMKEKDERRRALNMTTCLAAFVDPEHQRKRRRASSGAAPFPRPQRGTNRRSPGDDAPRPSHQSHRELSQDGGSSAREHPKAPSHNRKKANPSPEERSHDNAYAGNQPNRRYRKSSQEESPADHSESKHSSRTDSDGPQKKRVDDDDHLHTFRRGAQLLYDSLSLHQGGGVVFLDTMTLTQNEPDDSGGWNLAENTRSDMQFQYEPKDGSTTHATTQVPTAFNERQPRRRGMSGVLGAAGSANNRKERNYIQTDDFIPISPVELHKLIKRHPRGQLFNLDIEGFTGSSSSGDDQAAFDLHISHKSFPSESEGLLLRKHFPSSRQVIFIPLYDSTSSRWTTCFVYNTYGYHDLTQNPDFLFCIAFCNCVMTEIARLATLAADQQKSDFIGSISHELRSPLHGILASMEFLHDTDTTSFQLSLIETADACARTLLDTINMVLDYSRLNAFERNANKARRTGKRGQLPAGFAGSSNGFQPLLNIYGDVDLTAITEEVVEGVSTGQIFKDVTSVDGDDMPLNQRARSNQQRRLSEAGTHEAVQAMEPEVKIMIDIGTRSAGWRFVTQPGAFRRIVMNLFGNSIKYTSQGYIVVKLEAEDVEKGTSGVPTDVTTYITLKVTDTGKGISPEYLRNKLFTPFSQESSMNPGTGLGLSLVKGIVNMLNGEITVKSTVGVGTEISVRLPMSSHMSSTTTPSSASSTIERVKDDSIPFCRAEAVNQVAALFLQSRDVDSNKQAETTNFHRQTLEMYFRDWFGFAEVTDWEFGSKAHLVAVDETDLDALLQDINNTTYPDPISKPMILVFCGTASRLALTKNYAHAGVIIEFLCVPVGPHKLARALRLEFEARKRLISPDATNDSVPYPEPLDPLMSVTSAMERVTISSGHPDVPDIQLLTNGSLIANMESINANMALGTPRTTEQPSALKEEEYPFPIDDTVQGDKYSPVGGAVMSDITDNLPPALDTLRPNLEARKTLSPTRPELMAYEPPQATSMTRAGVLATSPDIPLITPIPSSSMPRSPRLLLVDDNPVNLRLLRTFMRKREYKDVVCAEDGAQAVSAFRADISRSPPEPPDIVFMDISMPVLDGFAATRQIREIEAEVASSLGPMETPPTSLVIALTGLASGRDQSEAFLSGFDLYMTKPVSFREVGRLLDNWQANGGATRAKLPHGSLTGDSRQD